MNIYYILLLQHSILSMVVGVSFVQHYIKLSAMPALARLSMRDVRVTFSTTSTRTE